MNMIGKNNYATFLFSPRIILIRLNGPIRSNYLQKVIETIVFIVKMKYEQLIEAVGSNGRFQKRLYVLLFLATIPNGLTSLLTVFTHYTPPFHCNILPEELNRTFNETRMETIKDLLIPKKKEVYDSCKMYNVSFDQIMELWNDENLENVNLTYRGMPIDCPNGFYYKKDSELETAVTEYGMVCDRAWMKPLLTSLYMAGVGIGSLSGKLSDKYGRRPVFLFFTYACFIAIGLNGFSWNVISYGIFIFLSGLCNLVNFVVAVIISCEFMNVDDRNAMSLGPFIAFSIGYTLSVLFGYFITNWRWLYGLNLVLGLTFIPYYWFIPESPRWLLTKGKMEEAENILTEIARVNGKTIDVKQLLEKEVLLEDDFSSKQENKAGNETLATLFRNRTLRNRFLVSCFAWFSISLVYYTIALNTSGLAGDRFINCLLVAAVEVPADIIGFLCVKYLGRPASQAVLMGIGGISCTAAPFLNNATLTVVVAMIGKFAITSEFFIIYIYHTELTPTLLRNLCVGLGSFSARISGFLAPYIWFAGESIHQSIPFLLMGGVSFLTSILTIIFLPETRGVALPENFNDALKNKKYIRLGRKNNNGGIVENDDDIKI